MKLDEWAEKLSFGRSMLSKKELSWRLCQCLSAIIGYLIALIK